MSHKMVKLMQPAIVYSSIFNEIKNNSLDSVTLICKDGERLSISCILLVAISPYLAEVMRNIDTEECIIIVPEVEATAFKALFKYALDFNNSPILPEFEYLTKLDGVIWETICKVDSKEYVNGKEIEENFVMDEKIIKKELITESNIVEKKKIRNTMYKNETIMEKFDGLLLNSTRNYLDNLPVEVIINSDENKNKRKRNGNKENDYVVDIKQSDSQKSKKLNLSNTVVDYDPSFLDSDSSERDGFRYGRKKGKIGSKRRDKEPVPKFKKEIINKCKISTKKKSNKSNESSKEDKYVKSDDYLARNEMFLLAQDKLAQEMKDINNLEDPQLLWCKHHGLDPRLYFLMNQSKEVELICPLCMYTTREKKTGQAFFKHLREHKYKYYSCDCQHVTNRLEHLQVDHWKWQSCDRCSEIVPSTRLPIHTLYKHKKKEGISCNECEDKKVFTDHLKFKVHMDEHLLQRSSCGCENIVFKSFQHKRHHMQVVHIKEKLGCHRKGCYFLCITQEEMDHHISLRHSSTSICDICGKSWDTATSLKQHKENHHAPKHQCPLCPSMLSASRLKIHIAKVHKGRDGGICNICGVKVNYLPLHMNQAHCSDKKYKCEYCSKSFYYRCYLKKHLNIHLKQNIYKCRYGCDFPYIDDCNRNAHEKKKHGQVFTQSVLNKIHAE